MEMPFQPYTLTEKEKNIHSWMIAVSLLYQGAPARFDLWESCSLQASLFVSHDIMLQAVSFANRGREDLRKPFFFSTRRHCALFVWKAQPAAGGGGARGVKRINPPGLPRWHFRGEKWQIWPIFTVALENLLSSWNYLKLYKRLCNKIQNLAFLKQGFAFFNYLATLKTPPSVS